LDHMYRAFVTSGFQLSLVSKIPGEKGEKE
jgi:hypothetical protein